MTAILSEAAFKICEIKNGSSSGVTGGGGGRSAPGGKYNGRKI